MKKLLLFLAALLLSANAYATTCTIPYESEITGGYIFAAHWNANFAAISSCLNNQTLDGTTNIAIGGIQTANIANLAVTDAKISGITTAGKVNGSAITAINNIPSGAGVIPTANLGSGTANSSTFLRGDQTWISASPPYIKVTNTQTSGTDGGSTTSGSWQTAVLNTKDIDTGSIATLSGNSISLPAGTYQVSGVMPIFYGGGGSYGAQSRLYNSTASAALIIGTSAAMPSSATIPVLSNIRGQFTLSTTSSVILQYSTNGAQSTTGQGVSAGQGTEVYATLEVWKIS